MTPRRRYLTAVAAAALALVAGPALAGCGGDDDETADGGAETQQPEPAPESAGPYGEDDEGPVVPDEGHEGGGPDPGTGEGSSGGSRYGGGSGNGGGSGGTGGGGSSGGGGNGNDGLSPPERFEQFCEQNPEACS